MSGCLLVVGLFSWLLAVGWSGCWLEWLLAADYLLLTATFLRLACFGFFLFAGLLAVDCGCWLVADGLLTSWLLALG